MDEQGAVEERCDKCSALVPEDDGYENGRGDLLCTVCFVDQWGPSTEELTMSFGGGVSETRPVGAAPFWNSGELGGLDLS